MRFLFFVFVSKEIFLPIFCSFLNSDRLQKIFDLRVSDWGRKPDTGDSSEEMLRSFVNGLFLLGAGYAYPAFQCFKTLEKNKVKIEELRFWCKYWIIIALVTVVERSADVFIAWVPFYGELKLALVVYLWHPRFSGSRHVYDKMLRPFLAKHGKYIDESLSMMRATGWDTGIFYWEYVAEFVQALFLQGVSHLATQTDKPPRVDTPKVTEEQDSTRPFGPGELPTSDARESSPHSQNDFIYVDNYEKEEKDPSNLGHESSPLTSNKSDAADADHGNSHQPHPLRRRIG
ncbi:hypothetical protein MLD38_018529 [Melastoma candidum]|uniref:Uncharacterized protein n=1 Tax=Melastoma candidum TaxID=119954 RepID=A0ACB9QTI9_9MYRT|nr:hypothetical protein MLD38_018529 [Melastoma candidum]